MLARADANVAQLKMEPTELVQNRARRGPEGQDAAAGKGLSFSESVRHVDSRYWRMRRRWERLLLLLWTTQ